MWWAKKMYSAALHKNDNTKIIPVSSLQTNSRHSILRDFTNSRTINQKFVWGLLSERRDGWREDSKILWRNYGRT